MIISTKLLGVSYPLRVTKVTSLDKAVYKAITRFVGASKKGEFIADNTTLSVVINNMYYSPKMIGLCVERLERIGMISLTYSSDGFRRIGIVATRNNVEKAREYFL